MRISKGLAMVASTTLAALLLCSCGRSGVPVAATAGTQPSAAEALSAFVDGYMQERESGRATDLNRLGHFERHAHLTRNGGGQLI